MFLGLASVIIRLIGQGRRLAGRDSYGGAGEMTGWKGLLWQGRSGEMTGWKGLLWQVRGDDWLEGTVMVSQGIYIYIYIHIYIYM